MPTARIDALAAEGLRLNQFLVEPACTASRAALATGRYPIRTGLAQDAFGVEGLGPGEFTIGDLFKSAGYRTAYFGKWHLGRGEHEPQYRGFDEWRFGFHGSSDASLHPEKISRSHGPAVALDANTVKVREAPAPRAPSTELADYDAAYRRRIDNEMTDAAVRYIERGASSDEPFFLLMSLTRPHFPNLPSEEFHGASRIGDYGDCVMELDHNVGRVVDAIAGAGIEADTVMVFASDNGPATTRTVPTELHAASPGPFRGELGEPWEGSLRTVGIVRWPGSIAPGVSDEMVSIMDFMPTFAGIIGAELPGDRPIDGVDQSVHLIGGQEHSPRHHLLTFIGSELAAVRWRQWRMYPREVAGDIAAHNIEADPRELRDAAAENAWLFGIYVQIVANYRESLAAHPNAPRPNAFDA
jgi:arylsulfatase